MANKTAILFHFLHHTNAKQCPKRLCFTDTRLVRNDYLPMDLVQLGKNISAKRRLLKLSQEDLSFELNISVPALSRIEQGKSDISFNRLLQIAEILKVPVSALVQEDTTTDFRQLSADIAQIKADVAEIKNAAIWT